MNASWLCLCATLPLAAGASLRIVAVERKGLPPFEDDRRIYQLAGEEAARLRPGEVLQLVRPGDPRDPGRLKVTGQEGGRASACLEARGTTYPLVGDQAILRRADPVPSLPALALLPDLALRPPRSGPPPEASPGRVASAPSASPVHAADRSHAAPLLRPAADPERREPIFFLEGDGSLSPKGREKLQGVVRTWGAGGRWSLAIPEDRVIPDKVRQARIRAIRSALAALGVDRAGVRETQRRSGDHGDVVYVEKG